MALFTFQLPHYTFSLNWFMLDIDNKQLITSNTVPNDIQDTKDIILTEVPIPGLNFAPIQPSGGGNRKIKFVLPLIKRNNTLGASLLLQQFHTLRNQVTGIKDIFSQQFRPTPKVLFKWGTASLPLIYWVKKADITNKKGWINQQGRPQYSEVDIELWLDETHRLYKAEQIFRKVSSITASFVYGIDNRFNPGKGKQY